MMNERMKRFSENLMEAKISKMLESIIKEGNDEAEKKDKDDDNLSNNSQNNENDITCLWERQICGSSKLLG